MNLTAQQQTVVAAEGDFLLLACPGSGKTRSAAARVARLVNERATKVAICSYTNVGAQRLSTVLGREAGAILGPQHFIGTIHGFLLDYVVYPFAQLVGARAAPRVRDGHWPDVRIAGDNRKRIGLDAFRYRSDGTLVPTTVPRSVRESPEQLVELVGEEVRRRKFGMFASSGAVTADDAMWVALQILRAHPQVCDAVAGRFDELLLDEAQDTSELPLGCLAEIKASGRLRSLVLIGDLKQSIYSFQGASAAGCSSLAAERGLRTIGLTENHRCSQRICNVAANFSAREAPDQAVGPHADCDIVPEIIVYPAADPQAAMGIFRERLSHHGIEPTSAAVLARTWRTAARLNGEVAPVDIKDRPERLGRLAATLASGRLTRSHVQWLQRQVAYCAWDVIDPNELEEGQRIAVRTATYGLMGSLPVLAGDLRTWIKAAAKELQRVGAELVDEVAHTGGRMLPSCEAHAGHQAADVFLRPALDLSAQTVHSMKGEDREAVMIVIHRPHGNDPTAQLELWGTTVEGQEIAEEREEERRVTFVALTRAQRYCLVAVPDTPRGREIAAACGGLGFASIAS